jgi:hypothetical protein
MPGWSPETAPLAWFARQNLRQGTEALGVVRLAITMQQPRAGDRDFAEDTPLGNIVMPLAGLRLPAVGGLPVGGHAMSGLCFHDHMLDRA